MLSMHYTKGMKMSKKFKIKKMLRGEEAKVDAEGGYKDVKFEGYLCSAEADGAGRRAYFTIDETGVAYNSYKLNEMGMNKTSTVSFHLKNKKNKVVTMPAETMLHYLENHSHENKPNVVSVVRYFRRWNYELAAWSNLGGLTVICELDYLNMLMTVYPAFCSDSENFEKQSGLFVARERKAVNIGIYFPFLRELSIQENLVASLNNKSWKFTASKHNIGSVDQIRSFDSIAAKFEDCLFADKDLSSVL